MRKPAFFLIALVSALIPVSTRAFVGGWRSFTNVNHINAMAAYHGNLYAGTMGGIRRINPVTLAEKDFSINDGLTDLRAMSLAVDAEDRLWAASLSGELFRLEGETWSPWGKGYKAAGWKANTRALISAGNYLVLGSEKGISFFDRHKGVAQANLTKFGAAGATGITGMVRVGDTLYVATGSEVLKASVDFNDVLSSKFGTIFDPQIWKSAADIATPESLGFPATVDVVSGKAADTLTDSIVTVKDLRLGHPFHLAYLDGKVVSHDTGTVLVSPLRVKAVLGRPVIIGDSTFNVFKGYETALTMGGKVFLGGKFDLIYYDLSSKGFFPVTPPRNYPVDILANVSASSRGVFALTGGQVGPGVVYRFENGAWQAIQRFPTSPEVLQNELRILSQTADGEVLMGNWGLGVLKIGTGGVQAFHAGSKTCMPPTIAPEYTVVSAMSDPFGDHVWLSLLQLPTGSGNDTHWMVHLDLKTGKVTCPELKGEGYHIFGTRILSDTLFGVADDHGLFLYRWSASGDLGAISLAGRMGSGSDIGRDMAMDAYGRLWVIFNDKVGYVDSLDAKLSKSGSLQAVFPENIDGKSCRMMETDVRQGFWVGCDNGLFHIQPTAQADAPAVEHFLAEDGLAADRIFDISVDRQSGKIWAATEGGISVYESPSQAPVSGLDEVKAFPNPFLKKHRLLILGNIPGGASADILTQSGNVVRHFLPREAKGNQFQWDGNNASGQAVKPGVYFYSVMADGKSSQGKIIVAR